MSREERRERGKRIVEQMLRDLCAEKSASLSGSIVWHKDSNRMRYWLEVTLDGRNVKWPLSYEQLEDCVTDKTGRRRIKAGLRFYVVRTGDRGMAQDSRRSRCNPTTDPLIVLDFDCHRERPPALGMRVVRDNGFILKNKGGTDAINVQIRDIVLESGVAQFKTITAISPGKECEIQATFPSKAAILQHDFEDTLMDEWNSRGSVEELEPIQVSVLYSDYSANRYHARFEIEYNVYQGTAETRFVDCFRSDDQSSVQSEVPKKGDTVKPVPVEADVFVSHATEDKPYIEPLVKALGDAGIKVWYDRITLEWGDDLRSGIDRGLANCRFGIVVFSKAFLAKKKWTEYELNGLLAREKVGEKVILPIWHGVTREDLLVYGPSFADRLAMITSNDDYQNIVSTLHGMLSRRP